MGNGITYMACCPNKPTPAPPPTAAADGGDGEGEGEGAGGDWRWQGGLAFCTVLLLLCCACGYQQHRRASTRLARVRDLHQSKIWNLEADLERVKRESIRFEVRYPGHRRCTTGLH